MSRMLQELESQNQKKCDTDLQGCDKPGTPLRKLENEPLMFTLLIAWEEQVSAEEVRTTLEAVDTEVSKGRGLSWVICGSVVDCLSIACVIVCVMTFSHCHLATGVDALEMAWQV